MPGVTLLASMALCAGCVSDRACKPFLEKMEGGNCLIWGLLLVFVSLLQLAAGSLWCASQGQLKEQTKKSSHLKGGGCLRTDGSGLGSHKNMAESYLQSSK